MKFKKEKFILALLASYLSTNPAIAEIATVKVEKIWDTENQLLLQVSPAPTACEEHITPNVSIEKSPQNNDSIYIATTAKIEDIEVDIVFTAKETCDEEPLSVTMD